MPKSPSMADRKIIITGLEIGLFEFVSLLRRKMVRYVGLTFCKEIYCKDPCIDKFVVTTRALFNAYENKRRIERY